MNLDFSAAIASMNELAPAGQTAAFAIANAARPTSDYLFASLLPPIGMSTYNVAGGNMTIRSTMAGLVAMDSPYPPGGLAESSTWAEQTAKIANEVAMNEQTLRLLQDTVLRIFARGGTPSNEMVVQEAVNFLNKVIIQPHLDAEEFLRAQCLTRGLINWTYNKKTLSVNYGVPASNFLPTRTVAGGTAYHLAGSVFWDDIRTLRRLLGGRIRALIAHPETISAIRYNTANQMAVIGEADGATTFRRWMRNDSGASLPGQFSQDAEDVVTLISYDKEAEILDLANPGSSIVMPFMPHGKLLAIGEVTNDGYTPGMGSTDTSALDPRRLGYTHIAPTVEGGGQIGRWAELYTPQGAPWSLHGRAATNLLPVLERPDAVAVAATELPA